jgi:hypothetical protein
MSLTDLPSIDMFDDIIDHSYDDLEDENRLFVALDTLKNIIDNNDIEKLNKKTRVRRRKNKIFYLKKLRITDIEKPVSDYI